MDTDKQITPHAKNARYRFLHSNQNIQTRPPRLYSLEDEFNQTVGGRNAFPYVMALIFFISIISIALTTNYFMTKKRADIPIDIVEFDDLKLKELLFDSMKLSSRERALENEVKRLTRNHELAVKKIQQEGQRKTSRIHAIEYSSEESALLLKNINDEETSRLRHENNRFKIEMEEQKKLLSQIQKQLDDRQKSTSALKVDPTVSGDAESRLYDLKARQMEKKHALELKTLMDRHEKEMTQLFLEYNPIFTAPELVEIISSPAPRTIPFSSKVLLKSGLLEKEGIIGLSPLNKLIELTDHQERLMVRLKEIPFENGVQPAILHLEALNRTVLNVYDSMVTGLSDGLERKNKYLNGYHTFLEQMIIQGNGETGYIIEADDPENIQIYMNQAFPVSDQDTGFVFRDESTYVGMVQFFMDTDVVMARLMDTAIGQSPLPMDKILINNLEKLP